MDKNKVNEWGFVSTGARVTDNRTGDVFVADNQHGWVVLHCPGTKETLKFEALDSVDHERFVLQQP